MFLAQSSGGPLSAPDFKILQDNAIGGISAPAIISGKVLGDIVGGSIQSSREITNYEVQAGDTLQQIADINGIYLNTLLWANGLTKSSIIKAGQSLAILPTDGVLHVVKSGDTVSGIAKKYDSPESGIVTFNNLADQDDIYIGDILIVPGGTMPKQASPASSHVSISSNYFIYPVEGKVSQGLHFYNAIDVANKCGTPIYAAAAGVVQRAVGNGGWNGGMGNHITILHSNGTVTYYGHLMTVLVKPGQSVYAGQNIGFVGGAPGMAGAGSSTGCHLHFQVVGATNPLARFSVGSYIKY